MKGSRTRKQHRKKRTQRRRGGAMPLRYVNPGAQLGGVPAGRDMESGSGLTIRNQIGGNRRTRRQGGFVPTVMEGFVTATSKYITPLAVYAAYKFINRPTKHGKSKRRAPKRR